MPAGIVIVFGCLVEAKSQDPCLAIQVDGGLIPLEAPGSLRGALDKNGDAGLRRLADSDLHGQSKPIPHRKGGSLASSRSRPARFP